MAEQPPIACELEGAERRDREVALRELLTSAAESVTERSDGIEVRFPGDADCLGPVAELIGLERTCCRFLRFELVAEPLEGPIRLAITGPPGTAEFLRSWYS